MFRVFNRRDFILKFFKGLLLILPVSTFVAQRLGRKIRSFFYMFFMTSFTPSQNDKVVFSERENRIVLSLENRQFEMNPTASFIWKQCSGRSSVRQISNIISQQYKISSTEALKDVSNFVKKLYRLGFIN